MYEAATRSYQQTSCISAEPLKLVRMCYEGAIGCLKLSRDAYVAGDYGDKGKSLIKAIKFINELNSSLDMQKGCDVSRNLRALYLFMAQALTEADLKRDLKVFDDVIRMLEELDSAWKGVASERVGNVGRPEVQAMPTIVMPKAAEKTVIGSWAWSA